QSIVEYRNQNDPIKTRGGLKEIQRFGDKAFEQSAGFLRIHDGENPLDASAVHPESYHIVNQMAEDLNCSVKDLIVNQNIQKNINVEKYITDTIGLPTLEDIKAELKKPGRDPREKYEVFRFSENVEKIEDLKPGMKLQGVVTNVTAFGAFVDVGVHQDGLVHISEISDRFIKDLADILRVQQKVEVTVLEVDVARKRIKLSLRGNKPAAPKKEKKKIDENLKLNKLFEKFGKKN
nr:S1 RNA-binding domain-containing protein [Bacteroidota bacterium]